MAPFFSAWVCKIAKMRSWRRMPLAPGTLSSLASTVSSLMGFLLISTIFMMVFLGVVARRDHSPAAAGRQEQG